MTRRLTSFDRKYLNSKILILMTKFSRKLHRIDGTTLRLQDKNIIEQIIHHSDHTENGELHTIYTELRLEILKAISNTKTDDSLLEFTAYPEKERSANKKSLTI